MSVCCPHGRCLRKCLNKTCSLLHLASGTGNSMDGTPGSSTQPSPAFNLSHEYANIVKTDSYNVMRSIIEEHVQVQVQVQAEDVIQNGEETRHLLILSKVLQPNRESVEEALRHANPEATLTRLVSKYFDLSENISNLCLLLYQRLSRARALYSPITDLLQVFPNGLDSVNQSQCDWAFDVFLKFDGHDNPFPRSDSHDFNEMRRSFSQLTEQLDHSLKKSHSRIRLLHRAARGSAICLIGTVLGVAVSAVVISTHALAAIVGLLATPLCPVYVPIDLKKKQLALIAQLGAASQGVFFHINDLNTIDCLVSSLYTAVEGDKELIRFALERGREIYPIHQVVKHLHKNNDNFFDRLEELEQHIFLCLTAVNQYRAELLTQIHHHQSSNS